MKKIVLILSLLGPWVPDLRAGKGDCCHTTVFDVAENMTKNCGSLDDTHAPQNVYIQDNKVAFLAFPNTRICSRGLNGSYRLHPSAKNLYTGYSFYQSANSRMTPVADQAGQCWRWQCKSGYTMGANGECMTAEENCAKLGLAYRNGLCSPKWCQGWESGFDARKHYEYPAGSCNQYRCQNVNSSYWFASASDKVSCKACVPSQGQRGGCYGNTGGTAVGPDWVYQACAANQYVNKLNGKWTCTAVSEVQESGLKGCWRCKSIELLKKCLQGNASACPAGT